MELSRTGSFKVIQGHSGRSVLEKTFWNVESVGRSVHVALGMFHWFCPHNLVQPPTCLHPTGLFWPGWRARDLLLSPSPFFNTTVGLCKLSRTCFILSIYPVSIVYHEHVWYLSHYLYSYTEKTVLHHRDVITQTEKERKKSKSHSLELPNLFYQPINTFMFQQSAQRRIAEVADSEGDFRQSRNEWMFSPLGSGSQIQK